MDRESTKPKSFTVKIKRIAIVAISTYAGVCLLISFLQAKLIYFPSRGYASTPEDVGLTYEQIQITTSDGIKIIGWYVPHPNAQASILFFHGNAGNMSDRLFDLKQFHLAGYNTLMIDYRGYGESDGKPTEQGTYLDAQAAWKYLTEDRKVSPDHIILFGRSLGGAVAIDLATHHPPAALIVESSFTSLTDIGKIHYPLLPVRWVLRYRYESINKVSQINCPKLFIHGREDRLIPFENGKALFEAASKPKTFLETPGEHNTAGYAYAPEYTVQMIEFIRQSLHTP